MVAILFSLLAFLLPFQLSYHFKNLATPIFGFNIDYLIPAIYISDVAVLFLLVAYLLKNKLKLSAKQFVFFVAYLVFITLNVYGSQYLIPAIYKWFKVTELITLILIIKNSSEIKIYKHFLKPLSISIIIVCLLAIWQFLEKGSIGGIFYFLGERTFRFLDPGIKPSPYSTFSHPNSLSGFLAVFLVMILKFKNKFKNLYFYPLLVLVITTIILSNSLNVYIALILTLIFFRLKIEKKLLFTFLGVVTLASVFINFLPTLDRSIIDRQKLAKASVEVFSKSPLVGIGLNSFIPNLLNTNYIFENSWQLQPVHNIYLLVLSETGVLGILFFCSLFFLNPISYLLYPVLLTGLFDHYWLTLQQNMLMFAILVGFSLRKKH